MNIPFGTESQAKVPLRLIPTEEGYVLTRGRHKVHDVALFLCPHVRHGTRPGYTLLSVTCSLV